MMNDTNHGTQQHKSRGNLSHLLLSESVILLEEWCNPAHNPVQSHTAMNKLIHSLSLLQNLITGVCLCVCELRRENECVQCSQSQCNCRSCVSRKSEPIPSGSRGPMGLGMVKSSHSMLSMPVSCRLKEEEEDNGTGGSLKLNSDVSMGEWGCSSSWLCSSSRSPRVLCSGSASPPSVPSSSTSSWLSEARDARLGRGPTSSAGGGAICTWAGGRDKAVLTGKVVMLAVTGISLGTEGSCWLKGVISAGVNSIQQKAQGWKSKKTWTLNNWINSFATMKQSIDITSRFRPNMLFNLISISMHICDNHRWGLTDTVSSIQWYLELVSQVLTSEGFYHFLATSPLLHVRVYWVKLRLVHNHPTFSSLFWVLKLIKWCFCNKMRRPKKVSIVYKISWPCYGYSFL